MVFADPDASAGSPDTSGTFGEAFEEADQPNDHVGRYPQLVRRTDDDLRVLVGGVTTSRSLSGPSATVSGEVVYHPGEPEPVDGERVTPLPTRHAPFEPPFEVVDGVVTRNGDPIACTD